MPDLSDIPNDSAKSAPEGDELEELWQKKREFHLSLARLPFEEKIRMLIELQKIAVATAKFRKREEFVMVWSI